MDWLTQLDFNFSNWIVQMLHADWFNSVMAFITALGDNGLIWILIAAALCITKKYRKCGIILLLSLAITYIVGDHILKPLFERDRPFIQNPEHSLIIPPPGGFSFPSGHTSSSFVSAYLLGKYNKHWQLPAFILAGFIGFSRIYLYVHFLTDVITGLLLGLLIGWLVYKGTKQYTIINQNNMP